MTPGIACAGLRSTEASVALKAAGLSTLPNMHPRQSHIGRELMLAADHGEAIDLRDGFAGDLPLGVGRG